MKGPWHPKRRARRAMATRKAPIPMATRKPPRVPVGLKTRVKNWLLRYQVGRELEVGYQTGSGCPANMVVKDLKTGHQYVQGTDYKVLPGGRMQLLGRHYWRNRVAHWLRAEKW